MCSLIGPPFRIEYLVIATVVKKINIHLAFRMETLSLHSYIYLLRAIHWGTKRSQTFMCNVGGTCLFLFPCKWEGCSSWNAVEVVVSWFPKRMKSNQSQLEEQEEQLRIVWGRLVFLSDSNVVTVPSICEILFPHGMKADYQVNFIKSTSGWKV